MRGPRFAREVELDIDIATAVATIDTALEVFTTIDIEMVTTIISVAFAMNTTAAVGHRVTPRRRALAVQVAAWRSSAE